MLRQKKFQIIGTSIVAIAVLGFVSCGSSDSESSELVSVVSNDPSSNEQPTATTSPSETNQPNAAPDSAPPDSAAPGDTAQGNNPPPENPSATSSPTATSPPPAPSYPNNVLPNLEVTSIPSGRSFQLDSVVDGSQPILLWFWAPH